jgi:hypothetical protein
MRARVGWSSSAAILGTGVGGIAAPIGLRSGPLGLFWLIPLNLASVSSALAATASASPASASPAQASPAQASLASAGSGSASATGAGISTLTRRRTPGSSGMAGTAASAPLPDKRWSKGQYRAYDRPAQGCLPAAVCIQPEPGQFPVSVLSVVCQYSPCGVT